MLIAVPLSPLPVVNKNFLPPEASLTNPSVVLGAVRLVEAKEGEGTVGTNESGTRLLVPSAERKQQSPFNLGEFDPYIARVVLVTSVHLVFSITSG